MLIAADGGRGKRHVLAAATDPGRDAVSSLARSLAHFDVVRGDPGPPVLSNGGLSERGFYIRHGGEESGRLLGKRVTLRGLDTGMASSAPPAVLALLLLVSPLLEAYNTGVPKHPQDRGTAKVTPNKTPGHQKPDVTQGAAASEHRSSKSHGYYDLYQGGYDKGFSDLIYWVPLIIIFGAGIIFLPVLGAMFATLAAGTAGAAVSTTVAGRRRRDVPSMEGALHMLRTLETAFEKYRTLST